MHNVYFSECSLITDAQQSYAPSSEYIAIQSAQCHFIFNEKFLIVFDLLLFVTPCCIADAGTLVDSYITGKIKQLKEQIATLEKREER